MWSASGIVMHVGPEIDALTDEGLTAALVDLEVAVARAGRRHDPRSPIGVMYRALMHEVRLRGIRVSLRARRW